MKYPIPIAVDPATRRRHGSCRRKYLAVLTRRHTDAVELTTENGLERPARQKSSEHAIGIYCLHWHRGASSRAPETGPDQDGKRRSGIKVL